MKNDSRQPTGPDSEDKLLCKSQPADLKAVYLMYAGITVLVVAFQLFLFYKRLFNVFQILIVAAFLVSVVYYVLKTRRDSRAYLHLYENHYETQGGTFPYQNIRDFEESKRQLVLKTEKKETFYAANAKELADVIRSRRFR